MLSSNQKKALATHINRNVDIPFLGERTEQWLFEQAVNALDAVCEPLLGRLIPGGFEAFNDNVGIAPEEAAKLKESTPDSPSLADFIVKKIDIPLVSEKTERLIVEIGVNALIDGATAGLRLIGVLDKAQEPTVEQPPEPTAKKVAKKTG